MVVEPRPARVARLHPQATLERPRIIVRHHQPVALLEQHILEVLDLLDVRALDLEIAYLVGPSLQQMKPDLVAGDAVGADLLVAAGQLELGRFVRRRYFPRAGSPASGRVLAACFPWRVDDRQGRGLTGSTTRSVPSIRVMRSNGAARSRSVAPAAGAFAAS